MFRLAFRAMFFPLELLIRLLGWLFKGFLGAGWFLLGIFCGFFHWLIKSLAKR